MATTSLEQTSRPDARAFETLVDNPTLARYRGLLEADEAAQRAKAEAEEREERRVACVALAEARDWLADFLGGAVLADFQVAVPNLGRVYPPLRSVELRPRFLPRLWAPILRAELLNTTHGGKRVVFSWVADAAVGKADLEGPVTPDQARLAIAKVLIPSIERRLQTYRSNQADAAAGVAEERELAEGWIAWMAEQADEFDSRVLA